MAKPLSEVLQEAQRPPDIALRLEKRLGLGTNPDIRRALYERLEKLVYESPEGPRVLEVIDSVVSDTVGKSDPGRYFAKVVQCRLQERGLMEGRTHVNW